MQINATKCNSGKIHSACGANYGKIFVKPSNKISRRVGDLPPRMGYLPPCRVIFRRMGDLPSYLGISRRSGDLLNKVCERNVPYTSKVVAFRKYIHVTCYVPCHTCYVPCHTCYVPCHTCYVPCHTCYVPCHTCYVPCHTCYVPCHTCYVPCHTPSPRPLTGSHLQPSPPGCAH